MDATRRRPCLALAATLAALCALLVGCDVFGGGDEGAQSQATATPDANAPSTSPEQALELYVQRRLSQGFVANCDDAERPQDVGKQCARFRGERDGLRAYELGPTFGEYTRLIILQPANDTWTIAVLENRDPNGPPVPGVPWPLRIGATVTVVGVSDCLRVREHAGTLATEVACLDNGATVTISNGPVQIDDLEWWELEGYGWSASNWLRYPDEASGAEPTATPEE
jgi:hypothetical protein